MTVPAPVARPAGGGDSAEVDDAARARADQDVRGDQGARSDPTPRGGPGLPATRDDRAPRGAHTEAALLDHHGDVEARGLRDFAVNVAVPRPPAFLGEAMSSAIDGLAAYPDHGPATARLAAHLGVPEERVLITNGAAEAFHLVARARAWRRPVVVHPQFTEPEAALRAAGYVPERHVLPGPDFALDADALNGDISTCGRTTGDTPCRTADDRTGRVPDDEDRHRHAADQHAADRHAGHDVGTDSAADLVVLGNPTNPTSRLHPVAEVLRLRRPGRLVLVDEAFLDVVPREQDTALRHAASGDGLVVVRSLTKTFGLAGVRAGFLVAAPEVVAACAAVQPHWSVNSLALAAVEAVCSAQGVAHTAEVVERLREARPHLVDGLTSLGFEVTAPAAGPFVLARHPGAARLRLALREQGIAVRRGDTFPGLDESYVRIAVRERAETDVLLAALARLLSADLDVDESDARPVTDDRSAATPHTAGRDENLDRPDGVEHPTPQPPAPHDDREDR